MPKIEGYNFGEVVVDGKKYSSDVIIYPCRINASWWRRQGHSLFIEDIKEVLAEKPEVLIVGTGASGIMQVSNEVVAKTKELGIDLIIQPTAGACREYNNLFSGKKTIACLHLTC